MGQLKIAPLKRLSNDVDWNDLADSLSIARLRHDLNTVDARRDRSIGVVAKSPRRRVLARRIRASTSRRIDFPAACTENANCGRRARRQRVADRERRIWIAASARLRDDDVSNDRSARNTLRRFDRERSRRIRVCLERIARCASHIARRSGRGVR